MITNGGKPKGFKITPREAELDLAGTDLQGATIKVNLDVPLEDFLDILTSVESVATSTTQEAVELLTRFGEFVVIEWDLIDQNDEPIPSTGTGMKLLPGRIGFLIVAQWVSLIQGVAAPLEQDSENGVLSEAELLVMGESSKSLPSFDGLDL